ncbi:squamosa promoter-binding protein 15 [Streptomyces sp. NPDC059687]|uniref:squamosa promoter-binding protein 15 n=1 Tax=Streptomyces sp. NPDC059687 TaxID=3346905 RepID=UPI0036A0628C
MSWVANVMVSVDLDDGANVAALSMWLRAEAPQRGQPEGLGGRGVGYLHRITGPDTQWGGWKYPECEVWAGALNHADLDALRQRIFETRWRQPNAVQLLVMDQEESFFRLWMIRGNELRQFAPLVPNEEDDDFYQSY